MSENTKRVGRLIAEYFYRLVNTRALVWVAVFLLTFVWIVLTLFVFVQHGAMTEAEAGEVMSALETALYAYIALVFGYPLLVMAIRRTAWYRRFDRQVNERVSAFEESLP